MTARRLGALTAFPLVLVLAGCGAGHAQQRTPTAAQVPLLPGSQVAAQIRQCDSGSKPYCALEIVILNRRYPSSDILAHDESHALRKAGWSLADGDTATETAANSPGHKLRLTYSTAADDLEQIDLGLIARARPITLALSSSMFNRMPAMSMMLEVGAS
jgi:hypothetical protein